MISEVEFSTIIKNLEHRWGLTLASFLPTEAQNQITNLQKELLYKFDICKKPPKSKGSEGFYF